MLILYIAFDGQMCWALFHEYHFLQHKKETVPLKFLLTNFPAFSKFAVLFDKQFNETFRIFLRLLKIIKNTFNPSQDGGDGGGKKAPPTRFSLVTSTNIGTNSQKFLTFTFNPFATLV